MLFEGGREGINRFWREIQIFKMILKAGKFEILNVEHLTDDDYDDDSYDVEKFK